MTVEPEAREGEERCTNVVGGLRLPPWARCIYRTGHACRCRFRGTPYVPVEVPRK